MSEETPTLADSPEPSSPDSTLLTYAKLFRLPNVFTAWADIFMGYLVVSQFADIDGKASLNPIALFICLLVSSSLIYIAGMILNDYFDVEVDRQQRPDRPLPSGKVSTRLAAWLGFEFLIVGVLLAGLAGYLFPDHAEIAWRGGAIAAMLATAVLLYDGVLKKTVLAPLVMGSCRVLNILLGMSLAKQLAPESDQIFLGYDLGQLTVACAIGLFIVGVTWFARKEAEAGHRTSLICGTIVMLLGIGLLAAIPYTDSIVVSLKMDQYGWWGLLLLLSLVIIRRCVVAINDPQPKKIQAAVKQAILSLIIFDAAIVLAVCGPGWSVVVVALIIPMLWLGRWVYST
ncbi:MAG: 4-hydroxybenzoate polyprenyltransferase [Blastopirellula sp.]|nr:MAG: 4-hydroxybenzoate polyprenyltransferase [Blastopirellula sp.]